MDGRDVDRGGVEIVLANDSKRGKFSPAGAAPAANILLDCQVEDVAYVGKDVGVAKDLALMMTAVNTTKLPSVTVIVGRNSGPGSYAMGARCSSPSFLLSWPHARSGVAGSNYDAWFGTSRVWDDGIISPLETRRVLSQLLALLTTKH